MQDLAEIVLSNAAIATLLALLATVVGRYCRRPAVMYGLWFLVLLKFVTPSLLRIPVVFLAQESTDKPLIEAPSIRPAQIASQLASSPNGAESKLQTEHLKPSEVVPDVPVSVPVLPAPVQSAVSSGRAVMGKLPGDQVGPSNLRADHRGVSASEALPRPSHYLPWRAMVLGVWVAGAIVYFSITFFRIMRFRREVRRPWPTDDNLQRQADNLAARFGLSRSPVVKLVDAPVPPMLWAMRRPATILLPRALVARLSHQQQLSLLAHELAHYYRRDHWVRWFEVVIVGLYWWHPVAWLARRQLQRAEEQCCDACVLWALPDAGHAYARAILETVDFLTAECRPTPVLASGLGPVHLLERRFEMILHNRPTRRLNAFAKWALVLLGLVILPLSAKSQVLTPPATSASEVKTEAPAADTQAKLPDLPPPTPATAPPGGYEPGGGTKGQTPTSAIPETAIPIDTERRLERLEKMMASILSEMKSQRSSNHQSTRPLPSPLDKNDLAYGSVSWSKSSSNVLSLSDLKKQRIDLEDELENLKDRMAKVDDQIAKLQSARSPKDEKPKEYDDAKPALR
jgi:beta-lactamase regulating signal transducer with metallopeptidase domain